MLAASISYFAMMALVPFCLFLITIFGYILGHYPGFYEFLANRLTSFFPDISSGITKELGKLMSFKVIGTFSLILYGVLSIQVFASLENAINIIFKVKKKRTFFWSIVFSLIVITFIIMMFFISFMTTSLIPLLKTFGHMFPDLKIGMITGALIQYVVPFVTVFFMVTVMYIFFPKTDVRMKSCLYRSPVCNAYSGTCKAHLHMVCRNNCKLRNNLRDPYRLFLFFCYGYSIPPVSF